MGPLIRRAFDKDLLPGKADLYERATTEVESKRTPLVLVVDDSITMRRVTSRALQHHTLEVITARDGLDAVETRFERGRKSTRLNSSHVANSTADYCMNKNSQ